jgi:membrane associated rhomboid family serine protease
MWLLMPNIKTQHCFNLKSYFKFIIMQTFRSYRVVNRHDPEDVSSAPERAKSAKLQLLIPAILKLSFFLVLLPFWLTLRHFKYVSSQTNALIVSSASGNIPAGFEAYYGLYRQVNAQYFQFSMPSPSYWPSLVEIATTVAKPHPPSSTLQPDKKKNFQGHVIYWKENRWCLSGNYCSHYAKNVADKSRPPLPPPGSWSSQNKQVSVHVTTLRRGGRRFSNRNLEYIVTHPSTTLLLSLLVGLAFYYWNNRVPPERVAKTVSGIIQRKEYYRAFSGATAHFEAVHLGFNLMALHSLGADLEPLYGSVSFLLYNVSLIPITTVIMMGLFEIRKRRFGDTSDHSSVGYSGVLFAWMVVSSLERDVVCPIPLFHKVCFHTFQISNTIKINMGPIIQLAVAQVLLKRASFVGYVQLEVVFIQFDLESRLLTDVLS